MNIVLPQKYERLCRTNMVLSLNRFREEELEAYCVGHTDEVCVLRYLYL